MKSKIILLPLLMLTLIATSCSVMMAANRDGTEPEKVCKAHTRGQFLALGAQIVSREKSPEGNLIEIYRFKKDKSSVGRALMHGCLDVLTTGLWELVATPGEAIATQDEFFAIQVEYNSKLEAIRMQWIAI